jgi:putative transposase
LTAQAMIVSDNGTELTSNAVLQWAADQGIEWHHIAPGKPMQNAFVESFMYGRPLHCKVDSEGSASRGSGAFMYAACSCGPSS